MRSMTAYASVRGRKKSQLVHLVLRSLNFKYLDIAIHNLPPENVFLEEKIKKEIKKRIYRGKVEVYVFISRPQNNHIHIDEKIVSQY
ncbi:MAG: hypothetical protein GF375_06465, partial [Candidatus Omnitrophica bacterium]|nr:hypothetical protein [Candidatus Omnitrophota bacterium]